MKKHAVLLCIAGTLVLNVGVLFAAPMSGHAGHEHMVDAVAGSHHADIVKHKACLMGICQKG